MGEHSMCYVPWHQMWLKLVFLPVGRKNLPGIVEQNETCSTKWENKSRHAGSTANRLYQYRLVEKRCRGNSRRACLLKTGHKSTSKGNTCFYHFTKQILMSTFGAGKTLDDGHTIISLHHVQSLRENLTNKCRWKSHPEVMIIIIVTHVMLMFGAFQADSNPTQLHCALSQWGRRRLTNNMAHVRGGNRDIQRWLVTDLSEPWVGGRSKHHFPIAAEMALVRFLHIYSIL